MDSHKASQQTPDSSGKGADPHRPGSQVLLADDDRLIRSLLQMILQKKGFVISTACDGGDVLKSWEENHYDLILMDVEMPGMNGLAATQAIREKETQGQRIPIIGLTAHTAAKDRDRCLAAGMDDCLIKPVNFELLAETLRRWIGADPFSSP